MHAGAAVCVCVSPAGVGVCSAARVSVQQGEPHLPSLAGRGSKVWPDVPEPRRRHLLREGAAGRHRQAGQRYFVSRRGSIYSKTMAANLKPRSDHLIQVLTHPRPPHQRRLTQRMTDKL